MPRAAAKIKFQPEDFCVDERTDFVASHGEFALYRLAKRSMGTREALQAVARAWKLPRRSLAFAGLKDFQAVTRQFVTIFHGPKRDFPAERFQLEYLGQADREITSRDITANEFDVVVRALSRADVARIEPQIAAVAREGAPNYFDDQRFGSLGASRDFAARRWCLGDCERALWLAIAEANEHDVQRDRREKGVLRRQWGAWEKCLSAVTRSPRREIIAHLAANPGGFAGALALLPQDDRRMLLGAFQSHLWNRLLTAVIAATCREGQIISLHHCMGPLLSYRGLDASQLETLSHLQVPLPSAREEPREDSMHTLLDQVLAGEGLARTSLRIDGPRDTFFSRGSRAALALSEIRGFEDATDDAHRGQRKLRLRFALPRGAYGTMVLKQILAR